MCLLYDDHICILIESGCLGLQPKVGGEFLLNLNICKIPIDEKYREGLMKRTLKRELKSTWNYRDVTDKKELSRDTGLSSSLVVEVLR